MAETDVYQLVVGEFEALGSDDPRAVQQVLLLREKHFVGHSYRCGGMQAIRLAGEDLVVFHDDQGTVLKTVNLEEKPMKKAA